MALKNPVSLTEAASEVMMNIMRLRAPACQQGLLSTES